MYLLNIEISNEQNNEIFPQVLHMGLDYDFQATNSLTRIDANSPLTLAPNLRSFTLDPDTHLTDIVSQAYIYTSGLLVSEALYKSIKDYSLQPHQAFSAEVVHRSTIHQYRWLHITEKIEPRIDFARSQFLEASPEGNVTAVRLSNPEELKAKCQSIVATIGGSLTADRLGFLPGAPSCDLFFLDLVPRAIYVSSTLRAVLLKNRFTGFDLTPAATDVRFN